MKKTFTFLLPVLLSLVTLQSFANKNPFLKRPTTGLSILSTTLIAANGNTADGNAVVFDVQYSNDVDLYDASKLMNPGENFGLFRNGHDLAVEARQPIVGPDTLFYRMSGLATQMYFIQTVPENLSSSSLVAELVDNYLHTRTKILLTDTTTTTISITSDPASYRSDRFMIVFSVLRALPVNFLSMTATLATNNAVSVKWDVEELEVKKYIVQRSSNGVDFQSVTEVLSTHLGGSYSYLDQNATVGFNFYRVVAIDNSMRPINSNIAIVKINSANVIRTNVQLYPNPSTNHTVQLRFVQSAIGNFRVQLTNTFGQQMYTSNVRITDANATQTITFPASIAPGNYLLSVTGENGVANTQMLMIQ